MLSKRGLVLLVLLCVIPISAAVDATLIASGLFELGNRLFRQDDLDRAESLYTKAIEFDSSYCPAYYNKGVVAYEQGDYAGAESHFRQAIECDAGYAMAHYSLGLLMFEQGDYAAAQQHFYSTIELEPENQNAHFDLGVALVALYRLDYSEPSLLHRALVHFEEAVSIPYAQQDAEVIKRILEFYS
jgi:tetratricopeptide (TPR) repeat protein